MLYYFGNQNVAGKEVRVYVKAARSGFKLAIKDAGIVTFKEPEATIGFNFDAKEIYVVYASGAWEKIDTTYFAKNRVRINSIAFEYGNRAEDGLASNSINDSFIIEKIILKSGLKRKRL